MKKKAFPKEVYLEWEEFPNDDPALTVHSDPIDAAQINVDVRIGVYKLVRVATVTTKAELR